MTKAEIVEDIAKTKKYGSIYSKTVERIVDDVLMKYPEKEALEHVKQKLHQVWGAYFTRPNFKKLLSKTAERLKTEDTKAVLKDLLKLQSSTKERLPLFDEFYSRIFEITGPIETLVEPACGVNALSYSWMPSDTTYTGFDVDQELIDFVNTVYTMIDVVGKARVTLNDILIEGIPNAEATMFLKVLVLLDRQQKDGAVQALMDSKSKWLIVSFPTLTLSGRDKGMLEFYSDYYLKLTDGWFLSTERLVFSNEVVFVSKKK